MTNMNTSGELARAIETATGADYGAFLSGGMTVPHLVEAMRQREAQLASSPVKDAVRMIHGWDSTQVLGSMNTGEGYILAALLDSLGEGSTADYIIRQVWEGEDEGSRDPEPFIDAGGKRYAEIPEGEREGEGYKFDPRKDWSWFYDEDGEAL